MKKSLMPNSSCRYEAPEFTVFEIGVDAGFAVSYDPTDAIEKPGSDQDYEEW
ncbi:MAG TPA: hypothetical protein H9919_03960 [Candidatus Alistipes excrementipullorum]|nr:hypothetical protein [Candidatus Alistipes excrementipullorum]